MTYSVKISSAAWSSSPARGPLPLTHCSVGNLCPDRSALSMSAQALAKYRSEVSGVCGPAMTAIVADGIGRVERENTVLGRGGLSFGDGRSDVRRDSGQGADRGRGRPDRT